jgi:eukaryotic-like serine/threonine-protein kinase
MPVKHYFERLASSLVTRSSRGHGRSPRPGFEHAPAGAGDLPSNTSGRFSSTARVPALALLPQPGDRIADKYALVRQLGEGGMGVVYEAMHLRLRQRLAIKVLRPDVSDSHEVLARFEREARATAQLRSIHAARVVDVDTLQNGLPYIVMEFLDGRDLDAEVKAVGRLPAEQAVDIVLQVAEAMAEAHALGIVHRDLKPSNLFVCAIKERRLVKVLDFGISKIETDESSRITSADVYLGTPCYAAPEQLRSASAADARSDIWSLGVILFELLTGRTPFEGRATAVIAKVAADPIPSPLDFSPDLAPQLARIVERTLQRDPTLRFEDMGELAAALAPFGPALSAAAVVANAQRERGRLGEILVADGLVASADLERALVEQRSSGKLLGRVLLDLGLIAQSDLLTALAKQQGIGGTSVLPGAIERDARGQVARVPPPSLVPTRARSRRPGLRIVLAVGFALGVVAALGFVAASSRSAGVAAPRGGLSPDVALAPAQARPVAPSVSRPSARPTPAPAETNPSPQ